MILAQSKSSQIHCVKNCFNHYPESIEQKAHIGLHSIMRLRSEEKIFHDRASLFTCLWIFEKNVKQEIFLPEF